MAAIDMGLRCLWRVWATCIADVHQLQLSLMLLLRRWADETSPPQGGQLRDIPGQAG